MYCIRKVVSPPGNFEVVLEEEDLRVALGLLNECRVVFPKEKFYLTRMESEEAKN